MLSRSCRGQSSEDASACSSCTSLSTDVDLVKHRVSCSGGAVKSYLELASEIEEQKDEKKRLNLKVYHLLYEDIVLF